jgi:hypothetical protein
MKKLINILLILAAIAALVATTVGLRHRLASGNANKKALAAVLEKNATLQARIVNLKTAPPDSRQTGATEDTAKTDSKNAPRAKHPGLARGPWGNSVTSEYQQERLKSFEEHKLNDREFGLKYYAALRSDVDMQYGPFYRLQQLTKEQGDALAEALFQKKLRYDKMIPDKETGTLDADADVQTEKAGADAEFAATAQEALGANLYAQFQLYERQRPAWDYVGNLGSMLSLVDMPLSLEQVSRLAEAIANANPSFQKGETAKMPSAGSTQDWAAVDAAAADFLTPEQLDFFKNANVSGYNGVQSRQIMEMNNALQKSGFEGTLGERSNQYD